MNTCGIKRGIFSLRECGKQASDACATCGTGMCQEHTVYSMGKPYCASCLSDTTADTNRDTLNHMAGPDEGNAVRPEPHDRPGWSQNWRNDYHRGSNYLPFIYGASYYDAADRNGFRAGTGDGALGGGALGDDDEAAGFSDS